MPKKPYKLGDDCKTGQKVSNILGQSSRASVYTTEDNHLRWEYFENGEDLPPELMPAVALFDRLMADIARSVPHHNQTSTYHQLGKALFSVLDTGPDHIDCFDECQAFIRAKATQKARLVYIVACFCCALVFSLIAISILLWVTQPNASVAALGALGGAMGALISVFQRSNDISVEPLAGIPYLILQGSARTVLGILFGLFLVCASQANLLLGLVSTSQLALFCFATVAGFSERLVPELLRKFESTNINRKGA